MYKKTVLVLALLALLTGCQKQTKEDHQAKTATQSIGIAHANKLFNYQGSYKGVLPCSDCEGIEMCVTLNENATYAIKSQYLGKGNKIFEQHGTFSWNKSGSIVVFDNIDNAPNQYAVGKNTLTQLDLEGKLITGSTGNHYLLTKQKATIESTATPELEKPVVNLNNKIVSQTVIKQVNPAVGKVTLAETKWKLIQLYGKKVKHRNNTPVCTLKLNSKDGRFSAYAGCNTLGGNYVMPSTAAISFSNSISTMMVCDKMDTERRFSKMLGETESYTLQDNILQLKKGKKEVLATFVPSK